MKLDIRYVAGLFDGEGSVRIASLNYMVSEKRHPRMQLYVFIGMTHKPVIDLLQNTFGGWRNCNDHSLRNPIHRPQHTWGVASALAATFLRRIQKYVIVKKEEVEIALEFQESIDKWKGKLGGHYYAHHDREAIWAYRVQLANRIAALKHIRYEP